MEATLTTVNPSIPSSNVCITISGNFAGKTAFYHKIQVAKDILTKAGQEKVIAFEYLLRQYPRESFGGLSNFKAKVA
jgi:hypothetical protein